VQLNNGELEVHLVVFCDLEFIKLIKSFEQFYYASGYLCPIVIGYSGIYGFGFERFPEYGHTRAQGFDANVKFLVKLIHLNEVVSIEVSILLVLRLMHIKFLNLCDLPKQILLIDGVAALIDLRKFGLNKAAHLKDAQHLLLFIEESKVIR